jgi:ATP-dependent DNA helicase DinG
LFLTDRDPVFGPGGILDTAMPGYEHRPQQMEMAAAVRKSVAKSTDLMVEAGTGVGKTFAYLVPLLFGEQPFRRSVVSTGTIALQEQLVRKDLPFLGGMFEWPRRFALLKGRGNYVCLRRLDLAGVLQQDLFDVDEERESLLAIAGAVDRGHVSLQEMKPIPPPSVWAAIRAEEGNCGGNLCRHRKKCPFRMARGLAAAADLVVVNHALLIADMALKMEGLAILPEYEVLVVDEAHRLENVAASSLGINLRAAQVLGYFRTLAPGRSGGWLRSLGATDAAKEVRRAVPSARGFFEDVQDYLDRAGERTCRLRTPYFVEDTLSHRLFDLSALVKSAVGPAGTEEARVELIAIAGRLSQLGRSLRAVLELNSAGHVFWVEGQGGRKRVSLNSSPVDVSATLRKNLFAPRRSSILTSATLSVPGTSPFGYFRERLGLDGGEEFALGSPFSFEDAVTLVVHRSMPSPASGPDWLDALPEAVMGHLRRNEGGAFVLFTSYHALNSVHEACAPELGALGYRVLLQGGAKSVPAILEEFRESEAGVLFGADSFWEGVDVPGAALSLVIITRLPFAMPGHPLTEARIEAVESLGRNAFRELTLPEAILRFKQGFGRLIRTGDDFGTVVVLDPRVASKWYGRFFLQALPDCPIDFV